MKLQAALARAQLEVPDALGELFVMERVARFWEFLEEHNRTGGFFSEGDADRILTRHLYECLVIVQRLTRLCPQSRDGSVVDVGSGPGLPGYLLACLAVPPRLTLVDASRRRLGLLEEFHRRDPTAPPVEFVYERVETLQAAHSLVLARAFLPLPFSVEAACGLQRGLPEPGGEMALATGEWQPLAPAVSERLEVLGYQLAAVEPLPELRFLGERHLVLLSRVRKAAVGYPRPWPRLRRELRAWGHRE